MDAARRRAAAVLVPLAALGLFALLSLAVGAEPIAPGTVRDALLDYQPTDPQHLVIRTMRLPRTVIGLLVGTALGTAGAIMQGLTRNALADPGILGVNAGAALFLVLGISLFGVTSLTGYVWFAFAGAALIAVIVYGIGTLGRTWPGC